MSFGGSSVGRMGEAAGGSRRQHPNGSLRRGGVVLSGNIKVAHPDKHTSVGNTLDAARTHVIDADSRRSGQWQGDLSRTRRQNPSFLSGWPVQNEVRLMKADDSVVDAPRRQRPIRKDRARTRPRQDAGRPHWSPGSRLLRASPAFPASTAPWHGLDAGREAAMLPTMTVGLSKLSLGASPHLQPGDIEAHLRRP